MRLAQSVSARRERVASKSETGIILMSIEGYDTLAILGIWKNILMVIFHPTGIDRI